jgi:hypothetical protein
LRARLLSTTFQRSRGVVLWFNKNGHLITTGKVY